MKNHQPSTINHQLVIIGAGMVGLTQAIALAAQGLDVTVIDREDPANFTDEKFDGRVSAIAWKSYKLLQRLGVWEKIAPHAEGILDIRVSEFGSNLFLHFDHDEIGDKPGGAEPFGFIVENRFIRKALLERVKELPLITMLAPAELKMKDEGRMMIERENHPSSFILRPLIIAADGKNSAMRAAAGISVYRKFYNQTAIVTTIKHSKPHMGLAHEHFLNAGPFAVLPMTASCDLQAVSGEENNSSQLTARSSLVWCEPAELAPIYLAMDDAEFLAQVKKRIGHLGEIELTGPRWSYPLELVHADTYVADGVALIGDAAHSIHPIAGQGVNLGFRDVEALTKIIMARAELGLAVTRDDLEEYEARRRVDNLAMITATDRLNKLFSNNILPLKLARTFGLGLVNQIPSLKKVFMNYASGRFNLPTPRT